MATTAREPSQGPTQTNLAAENERLRAALEAAERARDEALEQQAAMAEVLRLVADAPTDLQRVLDTIAARAGALCGGLRASVWRLGDPDDQLVAHWEPPDEEPVGLVGALHGGSTLPGGARRPPGSTRDTVLRGGGSTYHVPDLAALPAQELAATTNRLFGVRTAAGVPLVHEGRVWGLFIVTSRRPHALREGHLRVLETFANQAMLAIENSRLFSELQESNAALKETLEQQTATADILRVIASSPSDLARVLDTIAASAARLIDTTDVQLFLVEGNTRVLAAYHGTRAGTEGGGIPSLPLGHRMGIRPDLPSGWVVTERRTLHVTDVTADKRFLPSSGSRRTMLGVPMLRDGEAVGVILLRRADVRPFADREIALVETFAAQAAVAVGNARLFQDLNDSNATLKEALEQQTATAEVLRVIASSPANLRRVLDEIAGAAMRLCDAVGASVIFSDARSVWVAAGVGARWREWGGVRTQLTAPPGANPLLADRVYGRAILTGRPVHVTDLAASEEFRDSHPSHLRYGTRAMLEVPLLRRGGAIGSLGVTREVPVAFSEGQIALLQSFADQAVIAIENTRLFQELQERDERRQTELERAAAIQQRLLPAEVQGWPGVLEVAVRFRAAVETSGDFYDVLALPGAQKGGLEPLQVAVGDVAGKGMSAALVTALARSALQLSATVPTGMATPATTLRVAGQRLHRDVGSGHFVACALAVVEPPGLHHAGPLLRLGNAAQVPVLLVRQGEAAEIEPPGYRLPLGAQADGAYKDAEVELRPGDVVFFTSDGLVEAPAQTHAAPGSHLSPAANAGELFGFERLQRSAAHWSDRATTAEDVVAGIWSDLTAWCGDESHHDDVTLLVLRVPHL